MHLFLTLYPIFICLHNHKVLSSGPPSLSNLCPLIYDFNFCPSFKIDRKLLEHIMKFKNLSHGYS